MNELEEQFIRTAVFCLTEGTSKELFFAIRDLYFEACKAADYEPMTAETCFERCEELYGKFKKWELKQALEELTNLN